jgi:hypothetical protein
MSFSTNFINLIKNLTSTRSPYKIRELIFEFFLAHKEVFSKEQEDDLLSFLKNQANKQSEIGKEAIKKRDYSKQKRSKGLQEKRTYQRPIFVDNYKAKRICDTCEKPIDSNCAFRWMKEGEYHDYHCFAACFPEAHFELFDACPKFIKWKFGQK